MAFLCNRAHAVICAEGGQPDGPGLNNGLIATEEGRCLSEFRLILRKFAGISED